jgi:hypothetical protein
MRMRNNKGCVIKHNLFGTRYSHENGNLLIVVETPNQVGSDAGAYC